MIPDIVEWFWFRWGLLPCLANTGGKAKYITGIPNNKNFLGIALFHQVLVFDKAANQAGLTLSNAGGGVLGN